MNANQHSHSNEPHGTLLLYSNLSCRVCVCVCVCVYVFFFISFLCYDNVFWGSAFVINQLVKYTIYILYACWLFPHASFTRCLFDRTACPFHSSFLIFPFSLSLSWSLYCFPCWSTQYAWNVCAIAYVACGVNRTEDVEFIHPILYSACRGTEKKENARMERCLLCTSSIP